MCNFNLLPLRTDAIGTSPQQRLMLHGPCYAALSMPTTSWESSCIHVLEMFILLAKRSADRFELNFH